MPKHCSATSVTSWTRQPTTRRLPALSVGRRQWPRRLPAADRHPDHRRLSSTGATQGYVLPACGRDCSASPLYSYHFYTSSSTGNNLGPGCGYDRYPAEQTVANGSNDLSGYVYGTFNFTDNLEGWASAMAFHSRSKLGGGVEQWFGGPQPQGNFYDPGLGIRAYPIRAITPESYGGSEGTFQKFEEDSLDLAFGLRGTFADRFDWEFTLGGAQYEIVRDRPRMTVAGATNYFLGSRLGTTGQGAYTGLSGIPNGLPVYRLNLDRFYGPISAEEDYRSMSTLVHYEAVSRNVASSFVLSGDLFELPAGPLSFAGVVEASRQSYDLDSDARILPTSPRDLQLDRYGRRRRSQSLCGWRRVQDTDLQHVDSQPAGSVRQVRRHHGRR